MLPPMHPDDAGPDRLDNTTREDDAAAARQSLWWALHRPETYAVSALVLAVAALTGLLPGFEYTQAFELDPTDIRGPLAVTAGVRLVVAVIAAGLAVASVRYEDEDSSWSAPLARAALVVAVVAALLALVTFLGVLTNDGEPDNYGF